MSQPALEQRVAALEKQMEQLKLRLVKSSRKRKDWRRTVGMFTGDAMMKQILEEGRKIREADREQVRRRYRRKKSTQS